MMSNLNVPVPTLLLQQLPSKTYFSQKHQAPYLIEPQQQLHQQGQNPMLESPSSRDKSRREGSSNVNVHNVPPPPPQKSSSSAAGREEADTAAGGGTRGITETSSSAFARRLGVSTFGGSLTFLDNIPGESATTTTLASPAATTHPSSSSPSPFKARRQQQQQRQQKDATAMAATTTSRLLFNDINMNMDACFLLEEESSLAVVPSWRLRDRMKTVGVGLVLALNIGTDPPDLLKPSPCAVLETWMDPHTVSRAKARELIGERLEQQYSKWQLARSARPLKYRRATDPTVEDVRTVCLQLRRQARNERVLFHYNGRGVPRPTANGEVWVFDKNHTEYIPLSVMELRQWLGRPSIVIFDCSAAGILLPYFRTPLPGQQQGTAPTAASGGTGVATAGNVASSSNDASAAVAGAASSNNMNMDELASKWVNDTIVLCPCAENEWLPMSPDYPADIFTSCLTTPIRIALQWFVRNHPTSMSSFMLPENTMQMMNINKPTTSNSNHHPSMNHANTNSSANSITSTANTNNTNNADTLGGGGGEEQVEDWIPGKANDRKTPLGELNWIFTAVTDSIAWNSLPKPLFQRLFRQDLLVASMFRNFLLADRILRSLGCTPMSYPPLPPGMASHPLWRAWDLACETLLFQLIKDKNATTSSGGSILMQRIPRAVPSSSSRRNNTSSNDEDTAGDATTNEGGGGVTSAANAASNPPFQHHQSSQAPTQQHQSVLLSQDSTGGGGGSGASSRGSGSLTVSSPFFSEQLTAFEVWLEYAEIHRVGLEPPEQLPVVLQVLLSQVHRIRALLLLRRFLQLGPWAVNLSLSLGIFPYVMKLLQSPEYKSLLVSIWASILAFDPSTRVDLLKDGAFHHFVQHLLWGLDNNNPTTNHTATATANSNNNNNAAGSTAIGIASEAAEERTMAAFVLSAATHEYPAGQSECIKLHLHGNICALLSSYEQRQQLLQQQQQQAGENNTFTDNENTQSVVELQFPAHFRMWLCLCLGNMVKENAPTQNEAMNAGVHSRLFVRLQEDRNAEVRAAACYALGCLIGPSRKLVGSRSPSAQDLSAFAQQQQQLMLQHQQQQQAQLSMMQAGANFAPGPPGSLMPQRVGFVGLPNLVVPGNAAIPGAAAGAMPGQFQPAFTLSAAAGVPNLHWRPQHLGSVGNVVGGGRGGPMHLAQEGQPLAVAPGTQFLNQPVHLRPGQGQAVQSHYMLHGQQILQGHPSAGAGPPGFLVGNNPVVNVGHPQMMSPQFQLHQESPRQMKPTVFEDRRRLELDITLIDALVSSTCEASVVVRYEAAMGLACGVCKYLDAFVVVAGESTAGLGSPNNRKNSVPYPRGLDRRYLPRFAEVWKTLRRLQHEDPFPAIARAANLVVSFVHEHLLRYRMETDESSSRKLEEMHSKKLAKVLAGIDEEDNQSLPASMSEVPRTPTAQAERTRAQTTGRLKKQELRRVVSEVSVKEEGTSLEESAMHGTSSLHTPATDLQSLRLSYSLPKSEFYEWKKRTFDPTFPDEECNPADMDLLSPAGAAKAYQQRRNNSIQKKGFEFASRYACLAPKPPKPSRKSIQMLLEEEDEEALEAAEEEATAKKNELKMKENLILCNEGVNMTSMLHFHGFEDLLVSCGGRGNISLWDTGSGKCLTSFDNCNPEQSRMTTSGWINEESSSLFYVGCDDGTVRVWGGIVDNTGELGEKPLLRSAFEALSMKAGQRGSGLVCEWQPFTGIMLAGGNSKVMNCWDLGAERQICQIATNTDANVTTLTTAWDFDQLGMAAAPQGNQGFGHDIVVSGHSDGSLKIFDLRTHCKSLELRRESPQSCRPRHRHNGFSEHKSWVVATAFTGYAGRYELLSGTVAGEIKAWDLRMSSSIRTLEVQRSTMTALAVHSKIPLLATGSHAQFIKIINLDGDTNQVLRYHEKLANHRIGPVSCLAFHRYKAILAAGSTDTYIGIYAPNSKK